MVHAGSIFREKASRHLSDYSEFIGILPEEQDGFRPSHPTIVQNLARKKRTPLYVGIDFTKAYDSVDVTLLWTALARLGVSLTMVKAVR